MGKPVALGLKPARGPDQLDEPENPQPHGPEERPGQHPAQDGGLNPERRHQEQLRGEHHHDRSITRDLDRQRLVQVDEFPHRRGHGDGSPPRGVQRIGQGFPIGKPVGRIERQATVHDRGEARSREGDPTARGSPSGEGKARDHSQ